MASPTLKRIEKNNSVENLFKKKQQNMPEINIFQPEVEPTRQKTEKVEV